MANLVIGGRVLDVAAGTGEQTILAARRVGPGGSVLATDIAVNVLKIAAEAAHRAGIRNVRTRVMDAQRLNVGVRTRVAEATQPFQSGDGYAFPALCVNVSTHRPPARAV